MRNSITRNAPSLLRYIHGEKKKKKNLETFARSMNRDCRPAKNALFLCGVSLLSIAVNRCIFCLLIVISRRPLAINSPRHPGTCVITRFSGGESRVNIILKLQIYILNNIFPSLTFCDISYGSHHRYIFFFRSMVSRY